jgi:hypothetical protein
MTKGVLRLRHFSEQGLELDALTDWVEVGLDLKSDFVAKAAPNRRADGVNGFDLAGTRSLGLFRRLGSGALSVAAGQVDPEFGVDFGPGSHAIGHFEGPFDLADTR